VKNKFGKKAAKKHRETFVFSGLSVRNLQPRTQDFLLPRLDGQRKRLWLRLFCFAT
jgi:hypothetical protein